MGMYREQRGRPRGKSHSYYAYLMSIVSIARRHDLDPRLLVDALFEALENNLSYCGCLKISCREVNPDSAIFLITKEEKVIWQFPVDLDVIKNPALLKDHIQDIPIPQRFERETYQRNQKIDALRFGMRGIDVKAKVIKIPPTKPVITRWGLETCVTNITIADETGSIKLSLWNKQIDKVHTGDEVELKNCYVSRFAGQLQLRLGRKSAMSVINQLCREELIQHSGS